LLGGAAPVGAQHCRAVSAAAVDGRRTVLDYQQLDGRGYFDQAQFRPTRAGERSGCRP